MRFIDLFAGLGGFHMALEQLGHECVFASEINEDLRSLYLRNFRMQAEGDIRQIKAPNIPEHDVLCAGFPCQPFSKAGFQDGFMHATDGTLFHEILEILKHNRPEYLILENVAHFEHHDQGNTWRVAKGALENLEYDVRIAKLSPHQFGVPQTRERVYVVGKLGHGSMADFKWPEKQPFTGSIRDVLDVDPPEGRCIPDNLKLAIEVWQLFIDQYPADEELPSFPIWSMEFGATYPFEGLDRTKLSLKQVRESNGAFGDPLKEIKRWDKLSTLLPSHARDGAFSYWKQRFLRQNRDLYARHSEWIDKWKPAIRELPSSFQKLEWNCKGEARQIDQYILQTRPSGIRVKRANWSPALVALTTTQVPIVGWEKRYMTPSECKRLQTMDEISFLPEIESRAYQALGNAVNVEVVKRVARALIHPNQSTHYSDETALSRTVNSDATLVASS